ncbi:unnamed protein product [Adineta steineri]|uniref:FAD-binding FR-type domain-containing protein n=2 Tax=Adineta steineri TaxID=433720 RepID=A0A819JLQ6_9BILA|nr:unnamed protein product [Adineta steineri]
MLLNFNCTLVIILMLKYTILMLRMNKDLRKWIPLDDHIDFHKFVGRFITVLAIFHTISHMANFGRRTEHSWSTFMFTTYPDIGWIGGFTPLSGIILCIILAIIIICSMKWIRHGGHFQVFYWTHLLYLVFYIVLIVHARVFWKWIIVPFTLFVLEKIYSNLTRYSSDNGLTYILSVTIEPSNVICLYIHRPKNFRFKAGDYISINLPRIALYEYHPFTISSAPEEMSYLSVHIQASGNWTKRVYQRFKNMSDTQNVENDLIIHRADLNIDQATAEERQEREIIYCEEGDDDNERIIADSRVHAEVVIIKGPYSSCARCVFDYKHVVLIGGGIGITPYASILQSLMAQFRASHIVCKHCQGHNYNRRNILENRFLKKVDFIWVNRDHKNFEWFLNILHEFEREQETYLSLNVDERRFLDIHLHFTGIKYDENSGDSPSDLITKFWSQITGHDVFTALKSKTHIGRPNWNELFQSFKSGENASMANDVGVFFCGPPSMGIDILKYCMNYQFRYFEEKF